MIVAIAGRSQMGKSKLAKHLALALDGVLLDLAQLRNVLFPTALTASREQAARLYEWLLQAAVWNLHQRPAAPVVLDAHPLTHARDVRALRHLAAGIGHPLHVIECVRSATRAGHNSFEDSQNGGPGSEDRGGYTSAHGRLHGGASSQPRPCLWNRARLVRTAFSSCRDRQSRQAGTRTRYTANRIAPSAGRKSSPED
ncbi:AAA family ATPase [Streptomyces sp. NPDC003036]|uniref:AAA family ATPase n=1 Tax=Streptomyces sp. NPDC003036 TaxID=3154442 RepID=UPI0033AED269